MPLGSAVLEKLDEVQNAFNQDFDMKGHLLVEAVLSGDTEREQKIKQDIMGLNDLRQRFLPVASDMRQYLKDHTLGAHPEDEGLSVLGEVTLEETEEKIPQVEELPLPIASEEPLLPDETPVQKPNETPTEYNKSDVYRPFFLEAIYTNPGAKLADLQRKTHEIMLSTKIDGVRVAKEGDSERTNSGVYRYKAQTQSLRKKCEQEGQISVSPEGTIVLTTEGEKLRWGKIKPKERTAWGVSVGLLIQTPDETPATTEE